MRHLKLMVNFSRKLSLQINEWKFFYYEKSFSKRFEFLISDQIWVIIHLKVMFCEYKKLFTRNIILIKWLVDCAFVCTAKPWRWTVSSSPTQLWVSEVLNNIAHSTQTWENSLLRGRYVDYRIRLRNNKEH